MLLYLHQLGECRDTSEILERILAQAIQMDLRIKTIRYYRLRRIKEDEHLVSVDCAGHNEYEAAQIRLGKITKIRRRQHEPRKDGSFDVFDSKRLRPVVFQINPNLPGDIRPIQSGPLSFFHLKDDQCDDWLGTGALRDPWVDVPLRLGGRFIGKLSCGLDTDRLVLWEKLPTHLPAKLVTFQRVSNFAAPFLESLRALDVNAPLEEASQEIFSCRTYEELYDYCTTKLIKKYPFDYESADILVVSRDTLKGYEYREDQDDSELLILRGSSYGLAKREGWVDRQHYRQLIQKNRPWAKELASGEDGRGLTPWVWREGKPLRLNDDPLDETFEKQLRAYDKNPDNLSWVQHIPATWQPHSLLIVPIPAPIQKVQGDESRRASGRRIIGVMRFGNKKNRYIEPREEVLLQRIAERCLGPKLMSLQFEMFAQKMGEKLEKLNLLRFEAAEADTSLDHGQDLQRLIRSTLETFLSDLKGKLVLVNLLKGRNRFKPIYIGGDLHPGQFENREFELEGTLTGYVIRSNRPWVFINDMEYAAAKNFYNPVAEGERCALASAIRFGDDTFGALVLLSEKYDILPASYGRLVQVVAGQIGLMLGRQAAFEFASCIKGLRHDGEGHNLIHSIRNMVETSVKENRTLTREEETRIDRKLNSWYDIIETHCLTGPLAIRDFISKCDMLIDVGETIELAGMNAWETIGNNDSKPGGQLKVKVKPSKLRVKVNNSYLSICLFNLLKNAWAAYPQGKVDVTAKVDLQRFLIVSVSNNCPRADPKIVETIRESLGEGLPPSVQATVLDNKKHGIGLRLVRRLADWHRLPDQDPSSIRRGSLEFATGDNDQILTFVLKLPILH